MGNSASDKEFFEHYEFLISEMFRVTKPGRLCVVHCKDLPRYMNRDGASGLSDFPGDIIRSHEKFGWQFHSRCTIWKDPVIEMQRTKNHGLLYKELCKDSCGSRQGMADFLLVFRKWVGDGKTEFTDPVRNPIEHLEERDDGTVEKVIVGGERFTSYEGMDPPDAGAIASWSGKYCVARNEAGRWPKTNPFPPGSKEYREWSIAVWQKYASPVWFDIDQTDVLNYRIARDEKDEKHLCPLQLQIIARAVHLWSNPGDVVMTPFAGIGSELHEALRLGRKAIGVELKPAYYRHAVGNCERIVKKLREEKTDLFSLTFEPVGTEAGAA